MPAYGPAAAPTPDGLTLGVLSPQDDGFIPEGISIALRSPATVVAWATAWVRAAPGFDANSEVWLRAHLDPQLVGTALEQTVAKMLEALAHRAHAQLGSLPAVARVEVQSDQGWLVRTLQSQGFRKERTFLTLERAVSLPVASAGEPAGLHLRAPVLADMEAIRSAHNDAFQDHWGSAEISFERWRNLYEGEKSTPGISLHLSRVALEEDGVVAAYALVSKPEREVAMLTLMGTRTGRRGQGLARAMLLRCLDTAAHEPGLESVRVDVDSKSAAHSLYASLGFQSRRATEIFERPLLAAH